MVRHLHLFLQETLLDPPPGHLLHNARLWKDWWLELIRGVTSSDTGTDLEMPWVPASLEPLPCVLIRWKVLTNCLGPPTPPISQVGD